MDDESGDLVRSAAAGDSAAVELLLERFLPELRAYVRLQVGPALRARENESDVVQSICREVLDKTERFQFGGAAGFKRWLFTTALRRIRNKAAYHNAERRDLRREAAPTDSGSARVLDHYRAFASPSECAFDELTDLQRAAIVHSRFLGMPHRELAEHLGISEASARVHLHRGLARLAEVLDRP